jgi:hypothetical protein
MCSNRECLAESIAAAGRWASFFSASGWGLAGNQISPRGLPLITPPKQTHKAEAFIALDQAKQL